MTIFSLKINHSDHLSATSIPANLSAYQTHSPVPQIHPQFINPGTGYNSPASHGASTPPVHTPPITQVMPNMVQMAPQVSSSTFHSVICRNKTLSPTNSGIRPLFRQNRRLGCKVFFWPSTVQVTLLLEDRFELKLSFRATLSFKLVKLLIFRLRARHQLLWVLPLRAIEDKHLQSEFLQPHFYYQSK